MESSLNRARIVGVVHDYDWQDFPAKDGRMTTFVVWIPRAGKRGYFDKIPCVHRRYDKDDPLPKRLESERQVICEGRLERVQGYGVRVAVDTMELIPMRPRPEEKGELQEKTREVNAVEIEGQIDRRILCYRAHWAKDSPAAAVHQIPLHGIDAVESEQMFVVRGRLTTRYDDEVMIEVDQMVPRETKD